MRRILQGTMLALSGFALTACMTADPGNRPRVQGNNDVTARQMARLPDTLPPMKAFSRPAKPRPKHANSVIAGDFLDLSFQLESGRALPYFSRFESPVTLRVMGNAAPHMQRDLDRLLQRIRTEAGINIRQVKQQSPASITLQVVSKRELQRIVPNAACFVAPNVTSWAEYKRARRTEKTDWTRLKIRTKMAIFLPGDVAPQEMRDCMHEEIAQALGPVNDLYRLTNSVFNDDNFHTVLTGFDMLILRAYYAPELRSGMTRDEVTSRLPALLARINPSGGTGLPRKHPPAPRGWKRAIETALGKGVPLHRRRAAANRAVAIARAQGWRDTRLAYALFAKGRLALAANGQDALEAFLEADRIYGSTTEASIQSAHLGVQLAAFALSAGHAGETIDIVNSHIVPVMEAENAALLSTLLMIKAEALEDVGRHADAQLVRLDSLGWARYGFGSTAQVSARLREIAAISPG
ncbi:DUF2927 domain-containing protein [Aliiroseovarius sp. KMU-50]|uniref:DUF2927 domain-containing protein n=1 Tax=Aliiroseovarius salicola TaxID=3009082 RepID=A0ABT4W5E4_9RHOB|nr:DUF2927 domain-containing protein [Aliiroseovarius sp. KMU-50]MDA5095706.1 DUF2927 domain-containing protein [Aliiroseovarius sp. KMU-50]